MPETTALLEQKWDLIFFTGSPQVGKIVHQAAARHLTPAVLELGGKNPTIVHSSANIRSAARRIAFSRYINSGHICTAPDHVLVWPEVKDEFVHEVGEAIREFYGDDPKQSPDYGRVINDRSFERLAGFLTSGTVAVGGQTDPEQRYIAPTVLTDVSVDSPIMQDEVFGPILPVLEIDSVAKVIDWVNTTPARSACTSSPKTTTSPSRSWTPPDLVTHASTTAPSSRSSPNCRSAASGTPGMGKYHGRYGFEAFTNARGVLCHGAKPDPAVKYPPYSEHERMHGLIGKLMP